MAAHHRLTFNFIFIFAVFTTLCHSLKNVRRLHVLQSGHE